jgi:hypothetical protein
MISNSSKLIHCNGVHCDLMQNECLQAQMDEVLDAISCFKCNGKFMENILNYLYPKTNSFIS